jgi:hypothetical protein
MRPWIKCALAFAAAPVLASCVQEDKLIFITKTSLSLEASSKPSAANLGYDRFEGYIGPKEWKQEPPSVAARLWSGGDFFDPKIRQFYTVGDAANDLTQAGASGHCKPNSGLNDRARVISATQTTLGMRVTATESYPDEVLIGYRRHEGTYSRIVQDDPCIPSILAVFDFGTKVWDALPKQNWKIGQFFATGAAARAIASKDAFRGELKRGDWIAKDDLQ